jgi:hypothetical protein
LYSRISFVVSLSPLLSPLSPDSRQKSFGILGDVVETQAAFPFFRAATALGDQPREPAVSRAIRRPQHHRRGVIGRDFRADDQFHPLFLGRPMRPNHAGQAVAIGNRQGTISQLGRPANQLAGVRGSFEEGEVRFGVQFSVHEWSV